MASKRSLEIQDKMFASLGLSKRVVNDEHIVCYSRSLSSASEKNPVFVLIHGYPESAYMWRHIIRHLPKDVPIFAPDMPGYGASRAIENNDKLSVGNAIIAALKAEVSRTSIRPPCEEIPAVLIGHDRGARVAHRIAVSGYEGLHIRGICLIDIVPTCTQWQHGASPTETAKAMTGYFHWPFLANVDLATRMISSYGGSTWCLEMIELAAGSNSSGRRNLRSDDSLTVYGGYFEEKQVIRASCEDYKHGATTDLMLQKKDQEEGRRISSPLLLLYSQDYIGSHFNFSTVWKDWVDEGIDVQCHGLGNGIGHFGAEEAPEECVGVITRWSERL